MTYSDYKSLSLTISSELIGCLMGMFQERIPCCKSLFTLREKYQEEKDKIVPKKNSGALHDIKVSLGPGSEQNSPYHAMPMNRIVRRSSVRSAV
jgi:hypothetical protein